jgi:hypothetical protein
MDAINAFDAEKERHQQVVRRLGREANQNRSGKPGSLMIRNGPFAVAIASTVIQSRN